mmetsp:Transcript_30850/g.57858  ORF Transcript_30850/g.57858 Transcript_30850/m.57858 type:complete len:113 (-) Transcript_30850:503-841(-)
MRDDFSAGNTLRTATQHLAVLRTSTNLFQLAFIHLRQCWMPFLDEANISTRIEQNAYDLLVVCLERATERIPVMGTREVVDGGTVVQQHLYNGDITKGRCKHQRCPPALRLL